MSEIVKWGILVMINVILDKSRNFEFMDILDKWYWVNGFVIYKFKYCISGI